MISPAPAWYGVPAEPDCSPGRTLIRINEAARTQPIACARHLLAPSAELLLQAAQLHGTFSRPLCLEPGALVLGKALQATPQLWTGMPVVFTQAETWPPTATGNRVMGDPFFLPFRTGAFDLVLSNMVLCDRNLDGALVREMARTTRSGGRVLVSALTAGTAEGLLQQADQVLAKHGARLQRPAQPPEPLYRPEELGRLLVSHGLVVDGHFQEERAYLAGSGDALLSDPLAIAALVPEWLRQVVDARLQAEVRRSLARALDRQNPRGPAIELVTSVLSCVRRS